MRLRPSAAALALVLFLAGCDEEDPVSERLTLAIGEENEIEIISTVNIFNVGDDKEHQPLRDYVQKVRDDLLAGNDAWSRRFALVESREERLEIAKKDRQLVSVVRSVVTTRPELTRFLFDTSLNAFFLQGDGWEELSIAATGVRPATDRERAMVNAQLDAIADAYVRYAAAMAAFYDYLSLHPERAATCFAAMDDEGKPIEVEKEESELIEAVGKSLGEMNTLRNVSPNEVFSLNAASRRVFDPFPADLVITVPNEIVESAGFQRRDAHTVAVVRRGFWDVLEAFNGRFVSPDILAIAIDAEQEKKEWKLASLADLPRRASRPTATEVRAAIAEQLQPLPMYRVRWKVEKRAVSAQ